MSINHSISLKKSWAKMSKKAKAERMSKLGKISAAKRGMGHIKKMVKARLANANKK